MIKKNYPKDFKDIQSKKVIFGFFPNSSKEWKYSTQVVQKSNVTLDFMDFGYISRYHKKNYLKDLKDILHTK